MTIDFSPTDDHAMIVDTFTAFATERLRPALRASETDRHVTDEVATEYDELGFAALELPEALGGSGLGILARVLVNQQLGRADAGAALALDRLGPALHVLQAFGGEAAVEKFAAPLLVRPGARMVLVIEAQGLTVTDARVTGTAPWAPTDRADVVVGLGPDRAWVADTGVTLEPVRGSGLRAAGASALTFDAPLVAQWTDATAAADALAKVRLHVASLLIGVLYDACEFSRAYGMERVAFGQPIAHHQAMAFLMVDMATAVERARLLAEDAAARIEAGDPCHALAAMAFVEAVEASRFIGPNGVQVLGGHGFMADFPMEKAMREARALGLLAGGVDAARQDAGASPRATYARLAI